MSFVYQRTTTAPPTADCARPTNAASPSLFARIYGDLVLHGLWCFPVGFKWNGNKFEKVPLIKWGIFQQRPPNREELNDLLARFAGCGGAGIPTGPATGLLVVDADTVDAIEWCEVRGIPPTVVVRTKKGVHYYFAYPANLAIHNSTSSIYQNVDIRGGGGYVVAAGTQRPTALLTITTKTAV